MLSSLRRSRAFPGPSDGSRVGASARDSWRARAPPEVGGTTSACGRQTGAERPTRMHTNTPAAQPIAPTPRTARLDPIGLSCIRHSSNRLNAPRHGPASSCPPYYGYRLRLGRGRSMGAPVRSPAFVSVRVGSLGSRAWLGALPQRRRRHLGLASSCPRSRDADGARGSQRFSTIPSTRPALAAWTSRTTPSASSHALATPSATPQRTRAGPYVATGGQVEDGSQGGVPRPEHPREHSRQAVFEGLKVRRIPAGVPGQPARSRVVRAEGILRNRFQVLN